MSHLRWMCGFAPVLLLAATGCGGSAPQVSSPGAAEVASAENPGPAEEDESTVDLSEHHRHHHHGGFSMFIAMSLDSLGESPEQVAAISKIRDEMHDQMKAAHQAEKAVLLALADGLASGNVDHAKVEAAIAELSAAEEGVHEAVAGSLNELHAVLTPPQRAALVAKLEAHFEVWNRENSGAEPGEKEHHKGHLAALAKEVGLSPEQVATIRASLKTRMGGNHFDRAKAEERLEAFGVAFASDTFDAKTLTAGGGMNAHLAVWGVRRMAHLYEAAAPVLTPEQRTKLAESIRKHANYKRTQDRT